MESFQSTQGKKIILDLVTTIQTNAAYLSEVDGAIGDGDHGVNMNKGFTIAGKILNEEQEVNLSTGLDTLGSTLFNDIGGAMGPLYGSVFMDMAQACKDEREIDCHVFGRMLQAALEGVQDIGGAKVGDKTMIDTLAPAQNDYAKAVVEGKTFVEALQLMVQAAERGKESTRDLVAKVGRASRLGERSRGTLDAGAISSYLILKSMADSISELLGF